MPPGNDRRVAAAAAAVPSTHLVVLAPIHVGASRHTRCVEDVGGLHLQRIHRRQLRGIERVLACLHKEEELTTQPLQLAVRAVAVFWGRSSQWALYKVH